MRPDVAACDACVREIFDPANRRFGYPFTNCTHCGSRYSILEAFPTTGRTPRCGGSRLPRVPPGIRGSGGSAISRAAERLSEVRAPARVMVGGRYGAVPEGRRVGGGGRGLAGNQIRPRCSAPVRIDRNSGSTWHGRGVFLDRGGSTRGSTHHQADSDAANRQGAQQIARLQTQVPLI